MRAFACAISVAAPPDAVRAWWTDIDPSTVVRRDPDGTLHVRAKFGAFSVTETFRVEPDGSWGFVTRAPMGLDVRDRFRVEAAERGSTLHVALDMRARNALGRLALPLYWPFGRRQFERR